MEGNGLLHPERLLTGKSIICQTLDVTQFRGTGYIPGGEALSAVTDLARKLRERNPDLIYLLDRKANVRAKINSAH